MNKLNLKLKTLVQTCSEFPSQWEGQFLDGRYIYIRFRWGNLGFGIGNTPDEAVNNYQYGDDVGRDEFDGEISQAEMLALLGLEI